jgi:hypothetical protein
VLKDCCEEYDTLSKKKTRKAMISKSESYVIRKGGQINKMGVHVES